MHPFAQARKHHRAHKIAGLAHGGAVHADAAQDRALVKKMISEEHRKEAPVEGKEPKMRLDKRARGGRMKHHHTTVNVVVPQRAPPTGLPPVGPGISSVIPPGGVAGPSVPMPGPGGAPPGGPGGAPIARPLPAMPAMARGGRMKVETGVPLPKGQEGAQPAPSDGYQPWIDKAKHKSPRRFGGRLPHNGESPKHTAEAHRKGHNKSGYASGGRIHTYPKMKAGADSGEGRLEKVAKYGRNARP